MKLISQIQNEIKQLLEELKHEKSKRHVSRISAAIEHKRMAIWFIEQQPSEESLERQLKQREQQLDSFARHTGNLSGKALAIAKKEYGIDVIKKQIQTIKYILNHDTERSSK